MESGGVGGGRGKEEQRMNLLKIRAVQQGPLAEFLRELTTVGFRGFSL